MPNGLYDHHQFANAKLTKHLYVTGVRDDGYHLLDMEMVSLDLADELTFAPGDGLTIVGAPADIVPDDDTNLVRRALRLAGTTAAVTLTKNIPTGGGLGGGSSDAAAALRYAGFTDAVASARIGADVPFCVRGGRARVAGVGELLEPLAFEPRAYTLLIPPFGVNTMAVFKAFDELDRTGKARMSATNDLEGAALLVEPRMAHWRQVLAVATGLVPVLAGSGATWFVEGEWPPPPPEVLGEARWVVANTVPGVAW